MSAICCQLSRLWKPYIGESVTTLRVAKVREKVLENEKISRSGKSQGITFSVRETFKKKMKKVMEKSWNFTIFLKRC